MTDYRTCNRLLDSETNEHCEFDGDVQSSADGSWHCPSCGSRRWVR
jgi:uncharacterized Zn finger protein (UPF0148 family)